MVHFRNILLPTDLQALAAHAAPVARSLSEQYGSTLHVVHVCEPVPVALPAPDASVGVMPLPAGDAITKAQLDQYVRALLPDAKTPVVTAVLDGNPVEALCEYVRAHDIDLVVMGTHARGLWQRILLGSTSKAVMEQAGCAVLMVPMRAAAPDVPLRPPNVA